MVTIKLVLKAVLYQPLFNALIFLAWLVPGHNIVWAIIILTVIIRLILLPSSLKATRAQKRMRDLQPEIAKLQAQYKDDKQKQSQALMAFYKENKVNPLGSCLPLLIQFPILIVLYYVFIHGLDTSNFHLLYHWMPRPDSIKTVLLGLDFAKPDRWILPVIAGALQFVQSRQMMPATTGSKNDPTAMISKQMMYLMPVFTVLIAGRLPAALPLYWAITTLFAIGQQWWVYRSAPESDIKLPKEPEGSVPFLPLKHETVDKKTKHGVEITVRRKK